MMLYISGRISDPRPEVVASRLALFDDAAATLRAAGYDVFNPAQLSRSHPDWSYARYMREDLEWLLGSEGVAVLPGWTYSTGATLEVQVANVCRIPVHAVEAWVTYQHAAAAAARLLADGAAS